MVQKKPNFLRRLQDALILQSKLRKDELTANTGLSRPMRIIGACVPILAGVIVVTQVYQSANEQTILQSAGVKTIDGWTFDVSQYNVDDDSASNCAETRCFEGMEPINRFKGLRLPSEDPAGATKRFVLGQGKLIHYQTKISMQELRSKKASSLYIPGIRADRVFVFKNERLIANSLGNLPFFIDLTGGPGSDGLLKLEILLDTDPSNSYQGFLSKQMFVGEVLQVYRAHARLVQSNFPRQAVVIFLLTIGALTFAFFVFLDHKRELFALGLTISFLGAAEAGRIGVLTFINPQHVFILLTMHMTALAWYTGELLRLTTGTPRQIIAGGFAVVGAYLFTKFLELDFMARHMPGNVEDWTLQVRRLLLISIDSVPLVCGVLSLAMGFYLYKVSKERAVQLIVSAAGMLAYGVVLHGYDQNLFSMRKMIVGLNEVPTMIIVAVWIISALSSLGSLERRVQIAVADREQRLKLEHEIVLAQAVQESFISPGQQQDAHYDVVSVYQAVKKVGGDWVTWTRLSDRYSLGIIGDVVGKGIQAGLIVSACDSLLRNLYQSINAEVLPPKEIVRQVAGALFHSVIAPHHQRAMTAVVIVVDDAGHVVYTSLGHPPLIGISPGKTRVISVRNSWLSPSFKIETLQLGEFQLGDDETIVGFTDGVCDGSRQLRQFRDRVKTWHSRELMDVAAEFAEVAPDYDDQTLLLFRKKAAVRQAAS